VTQRVALRNSVTPLEETSHSFICLLIFRHFFVNLSGETGSDGASFYISPPQELAAGTSAPIPLNQQQQTLCEPALQIPSPTRIQHISHLLSASASDFSYETLTLCLIGCTLSLRFGQTIVAMADRPQKPSKPTNGSVAKPQISQISSIVSPPGSKTPPSMPTKRTMYFPDNSGNRQQQEGADPVDPSALAKALKDYETAGTRRERTPVSSPCRKRQRVYGDRYVTPSISLGLKLQSSLSKVCGIPADPKPVLSPTAMDKTYRRLTVCCMKMVAPLLLPRPRSAALTLNYISKRVCPSLENKTSCATNFEASRRSQPYIFQGFAERAVWKHRSTARTELSTS